MARRASSRNPSAVSSMSASGSSTCASKPAETSSRSGSNRVDRPCDGLPRREVAVVAGPGGQREVDEVVPLLVRAARARVERPLVERHEENRVVARDDVLRAVAVVDVPVDDRDALAGRARPAPSARRSRRCRTGRSPSPARARRGARAAARARSRRGAPLRSPRRRRAAPPRTSSRVQIVSASIQPRVSRTRSTSSRCVAAQHVVVGRRRALDEREPLVQHDDPLLRLGMRARRMQVRERAVAYELDPRTASRISSSGRSPRERPIR